jgi:hypothetical protein
MMSVAIEARDYGQAHANAVKLKELLEGPLVKMAVESEGIRLSGNGDPVVHRPQPEVPGR